MHVLSVHGLRYLLSCVVARIIVHSSLSCLHMTALPYLITF